MAIVAKFGGTSLANGRRVSNALTIQAGDPKRKVMVVSAPAGITDKLKEIAEASFAGRCYPTRLVEGVQDTFSEIAATNNVDANFLHRQFDTLETAIRNFADSREIYFDGILPIGEIINAELIAEIGQKIGMNTSAFHAQHIGLHTNGPYGNGAVLPTSFNLIGKRLGQQLEGSNLVAVVSGFHAYHPEDKRLVTLGRGGTDYTAAIVGRSLEAELVEYWKEEDGIRTADPKVVGSTRRISHLTPLEARELSISGAKVLHSETLIPLTEMGIPLVVKNTFNPSAGGTYIGPDKPYNGHVVEAIAHKKGYVVITMPKMGMDDMRRLIGLVGDTFDECRIPIRQMTTGVDSISVAVEEKDVNGNLKNAIDYLVAKGVVDKDRVVYNPKMALVSVVGEGMQNTPGVYGRIFGSVGSYGISVGPLFESERSVLFAVTEQRAEEVVRIVHDRYFGNPISRNLRRLVYILLGKNPYHPYQGRTA